MPSLFQFAIHGNVKCLTSQKLKQMADTLQLTQHPFKITNDVFHSLEKYRHTDLQSELSP